MTFIDSLRAILEQSADQIEEASVKVHEVVEEALVKFDERNERSLATLDGLIDALDRNDFYGAVELLRQHFTITTDTTGPVSPKHKRAGSKPQSAQQMLDYILTHTPDTKLKETLTGQRSWFLENADLLKSLYYNVVAKTESEDFFKGWGESTDDVDQNKG